MILWLSWSPAGIWTHPRFYACPVYLYVWCRSVKKVKSLSFYIFFIEKTFWRSWASNSEANMKQDIDKVVQTEHIVGVCGFLIADIYAN